MGSFDFVSAYRALRPTEARELVEARTGALSQLKGLITDSGRLRDVCRIAFRLPSPSSVNLNWFETELTKTDNQFSLEIDVAEASRIACLLLKGHIDGGSASAALSVLTTFFEDARRPEDPTLIAFALNDLARRSRFPDDNADGELEYPTTDYSTDAIEALKSPFNADTVQAGLKAVVDDATQNGSEFARIISGRLENSRVARMRLGEELNMLWWFVGEWLNLGDQPRANVSEKVLPLFVGLDLASFVQRPPGPYGAVAILRRSLGKSMNAKTSLLDAVNGLSKDQLALLVDDYPTDAGDLLPVHCAIKAASDAGLGQWQPFFEKITGLKADRSISAHHLALQTFRERLLVTSGMPV